jgi:hypothetical protein
VGCLAGYVGVAVAGRGSGHAGQVARRDLECGGQGHDFSTAVQHAFACSIGDKCDLLMRRGRGMDSNQLGSTGLSTNWSTDVTDPRERMPSAQTNGLYVAVADRRLAAYERNNQEKTIKTSSTASRPRRLCRGLLRGLLL